MALSHLVSHVDALSSTKTHAPVRRNMFVVEGQENVTFLNDSVRRAPVRDTGDENAAVALGAQAQGSTVRLRFQRLHNNAQIRKPIVDALLDVTQKCFTTGAPIM